MSNDLVVQGLDIGALAVEDKNWGDVVKGGSYLSQLRIYGGQSEAAKEGKIGLGNLGMQKGKDELIDFGKSVDVLLLTYRHNAIEFTPEGVFNFYDPKGANFLRIKEKADTTTGLSGCQYGPDFLVYIPSAESFASFHLGSKSARFIANDVRALLGKWATITSDYIKTPKFSWHAPKVAPAVATNYDIPPVEILQAEINKFVNAKDSNITKVEAPKEGERVQ